MRKYIASTIKNISDNIDIEDLIEKLISDVLARFYRMKNYDVRFVIGCTETSHTAEKMCKASNGMQRKRYFLSQRKNFAEYYERMSISHDCFVSTVGPSHLASVGNFLSENMNPSFIAAVNEEKNYCNTCDEFSDKPCSSHKSYTALHPAYKLKIANFSEAIVSFYGDEKLIKQIPDRAMHSLSLRKLEHNPPLISYRKSGSPTSKGPNHRAESWVDIALSYWTHSYNTEENKYYWPLDFIVTNRKNLLQDAVYLPCLYFSAAFGVPKNIVVRGDINFKDSMIPIINSLIERRGSEPLRYYLLNRNLTNDTVFDEDKLVKINNDKLFMINNLIERLVNMIDDYANGVLDEGVKAMCYEWVTEDELKLYEKDIENMRFSLALILVDKIIERINQKIVSEETWKDMEKNKKIAILKGLIGGIRLMVYFLKPFLPKTATKIENLINYPKPHSWRYVEFLCTKNNASSGLTKEIKLEEAFKNNLFVKMKGYDTCNDIPAPICCI